MIPVLFEKDEINFLNNGLGSLPNVVESYAKQTANSEYELFLVYPTLDKVEGISNKIWEELKIPERQILYKPSHGSEPHAFRIYDYEINTEDETISVYARSRAYDLAGNPIKDVVIQSKTPQAAMNAMKAALMEPTDFEFYSDITTPSSTTWTKRSGLSTIMGQYGSLIQIWGGEVFRENRKISLLRRAGKDNVTSLRLGKNINQLEYDFSSDGMVTAIIPYCTFTTDGEDAKEITLVGDTVKSPKFDNYRLPYYEFVEFTEEDGVIDLLTLNNAASNWFNEKRGIDEPNVSISVDMMDVAESTEYGDILKKLETVNVFDTLSVYIEKYNIDLLIKVNTLKYDGIGERNLEVELGNVTKSLFESFVSPDFKTIEEQINEAKKIGLTAQGSANGKNTNYHGHDDPNQLAVVGQNGDIYFREIFNERQMWEFYNGQWNLIIDTSENTSIKNSVDEALAEAEAAKQEALDSYTNAVTEAERLVGEQTVAFDAEMDIRKGEILEAKEQADLAISNANTNAEAIFGKLDLATYEANKTAVETELGKKLATATYNAQKQTQDALIASKVAVDTYDTKVTELNSLIDEAQSKADTAAADLLKKADTTVVNAELAKKLATSTYNAKMASLDTAISGKVGTDTYNANKALQDAEIAKKVAQTTYNTKMNALDTAISGHTTRIEATETGLLAKASTTDVNALKTRMSTAETSLITNADAIALKASQEDLDTVEGRLETTEAELVVQAGEIASKVAKTDFNNLSGRVGTAESTIIQHASEIASRVKQTDFDSLSGRVGTAESSITQQAGEIASKVATTTYNAGIASKENAITKSNTAPSHGNGKLWLNTSVTPNVLNRSNGTTWIKVTPTTAKEVGAFSSSDGSALTTRVSTAESSITQQAGAIALKASQSDLDTVSGRVTTAEGTLSVQAGLIASKVAQSDFDAVENRLDSAESTITQQAGEIASKVATTTYNSGIASKENAITKSNTAPSHSSGKLWLDTSVTPNVLKRSTGTAWVKATPTTASEVGAYSSSAGSALAGRVTTAESTIVQQAGLIASKVSQTDFDAVEDRLDTAESTITQQAGEIESKVAKTTYDTDINNATTGLKKKMSNAESRITQTEKDITSKVSQTTYDADINNATTGLKKRISTAESTITQQAGQIASKVSQTDFDALDGRMDTAESSISQQAGEIALRVTTQTYNAGIGSKENTITKSNTAPSHLNGRLWLDTSVTPNVLKRSTGSAWVKVTPTTPGEVGAYSASAGSALTGRVSTAETSITANTTAIGLRATKSDLDATKGRLTTAEGAIDVQAGQIALKANQTTVDTLTGRVGTAETKITANTTAINLRATKSSVDTLTGRVTTAEGSITTQAGQIALRATTATVNALTGRVSTAETAISANTTAINLRATKTEMTNAIDGIEIGGRNLIRNSAFNSGTTHWYINGIASVKTIDSKEAMLLTNTTGGGFYTKPVGLVTGSIYTFSYLARAVGTTSNIYFGFLNEPSGRSFIQTVTNVWKRYTYTTTTPIVSDSQWIHFYGNTNIGSGIYITDIKLEKGNKATDWTPAPEDVDAAIATVQANLTVEAGKITALTSRVSGSETNISNVTQTVSGINTTISTLRTDVNGKATIVALNQVKSTADGNKTTISNHTGRLTTVETNVNGLQSTVADKADKSQITQLSTSISTKVESATYNSKMTQLDNAINLRVVQGDVTAAILADKKIKDTRTTNQLPSWYFTNYPSQRVEEFKNRTAIGVSGSATYVKLVTDVPWNGTSGGVVVQTAYSSDGIYNRSGNSAGTAWGGWVKQTDSSNVLAQVNLSTEGVLIQGKRIQLDGDVTMNAAYITRLNTQTLSAITANITSIRSQVLVTDSVTSTHIKAENALIDNIFGTTALITRLTSKTAFINNIKAINISADKVTTGTLNAANVSIINMNAANITTGRLNGLELYGGYINGGRITSAGIVGELAINSASLTVHNDKVVNGQIQRAVVALSNEQQDFPGLRIWHGVVNSAGTVVSSFGSTNITPEDGITTSKPLRVGAVTITGGSNIQNSASNIMHITDEQDNAIDLGVKNLTASGQVSGAKVVAGHLTLDGGNNIVSNSNGTINFMRTDGRRTNIAANTIESTGMRIGTSSTLYLLNSDMMYIANANDDLRDLRVRMLSARDRVTGGNLSLFNNDIVHNGNADIHFTGANGNRMNIHAARISSGNQVMSTGNTYYALNGNTLYFADRNDQRIDIGVRTVSQSSEYRLKAGFEIIGEQEAMNEILKTDVVKYHFKGDDEPRLGLIIGGGYQASGLFVAKDGRSKKDSDIIGALMLSVKYLHNAQQICEGKYINEIGQLKSSVNSDILRINTFVSQHELEIRQLKQKIEELERKLV